MASPSKTLIQLCADDLLHAYKLERFRSVLGWPARAVGNRVARMANEFDEIVDAKGLVAGGEFLLSRFASQVSAVGDAPKTGPLLLAANHPGMMDAMAIWTQLGREDLRIIAAHKELLDCLPAVRSRLILACPGESKVLHEASSWLQQGGAVLTFPAGKIEPDPGISDAAVRSLEEWSSSLMVLLRRNPGTPLIPVAVKGCLNPAAVGCPLLKPFRDPKERAWAAATLQILLPQFRKTHIQLQFGEPVGEFTHLLGSMREMLSA